MQVRELVQLHRRYGTHLVLTVFLAGAITGCSGRKDVSAPPRAPASAAPPAQAAEEARPVVSKNTNELKTGTCQQLWDTRELHLVSLDYGGETREVGAIDVNIDQDLVA